MPVGIEDLKTRLQGDPATVARLKAGLERVSMNGMGYVSMTDSISLRNWLIQVYGLPVDYFNDVYVHDLKALGEAILKGSL